MKSHWNNFAAGLVSPVFVRYRAWLPAINNTVILFPECTAI